MSNSSPTAYRYEQGRLLVDLRDGVVAIVGWSAPRAEYTPRRGKPVACRPDFRLVFPKGQEPCVALAEFRATLPAEIARVLEPFASHQWNLLELLAARPEAMQLATHNPVLAYLLANNDHFRKNLTKPPAYLAEWRLDYTQDKLLEWLGFPGRPAIAKLLRKIRPDAISIPLARLLRGALKSEPSPLPLLSHLKQLNRGVLGLAVLVHLQPYLTPKLMEEASSCVDGRPEDDPGEKLIKVLTANEAHRLAMPIPPIRSLRQIDQLLNERLPAAIVAKRVQAEAECLASEVRRMEMEAEAAAQVMRARERRGARIRAQQKSKTDGDKIPLPPETEYIIRLRTESEAKDEGKEQHNCVATYASQVAAQSAFIYRVLQPERATLELGINRQGYWDIIQLVVAYNKPVAHDTWNYVRHWLTRHNMEQARQRLKAVKTGRARPVEGKAAIPDEEDTPF